MMHVNTTHIVDMNLYMVNRQFLTANSAIMKIVLYVCMQKKAMTEELFAKNIIVSCFLGIINCLNVNKTSSKLKKRGRKLSLLAPFFSKVVGYSRLRFSRRISIPALERAI